MSVTPQLDLEAKMNSTVTIGQVCSEVRRYIKKNGFTPIRACINCPDDCLAMLVSSEYLIEDFYEGGAFRGYRLGEFGMHSANDYDDRLENTSHEAPKDEVISDAIAINGGIARETGSMAIGPRVVFYADGRLTLDDITLNSQNAKDFVREVRWSLCQLPGFDVMTEYTPQPQDESVFQSYFVAAMNLLAIEDPAHPEIEEDARDVALKMLTVHRKLFSLKVENLSKSSRVFFCSTCRKMTAYSKKANSVLCIICGTTYHVLESSRNELGLRSLRSYDAASEDKKGGFDGNNDR
jgi:LSD1 subclass zinc finger protein